MRKFLSLLLAVALLLPVAAWAQTQATEKSTDEHMGPPKIIRIGREEVKPGRIDAHNKLEAAWAEGIRKAGTPTYYLAATSITGPSEAWFISGYDSWASLEKENKLFDSTPALSSVSQQYGPQESELLSSMRTVIARYREDLSYQPDVQLGQMRYFNVRTVRVKIGHDSDYAQIRKLVNEARQKANFDVHQAVFQVASGGNSSTYLVFTPIKSLDAIDQSSPEASNKLLGEDARKELLGLVDKTIAYTEDNILAFDPKMSNASPTTVAQDSEFWTSKATVATAGHPKKVKPAAKKDAKLATKD
jgi:hypothetical protein